MMIWKKQHFPISITDNRQPALLSWCHIRAELQSDIGFLTPVFFLILLFRLGKHCAAAHLKRLTGTEGEKGAVGKELHIINGFIIKIFLILSRKEVTRTCYASPSLRGDPHWICPIQTPVLTHQWALDIC